MLSPALFKGWLYVGIDHVSFFSSKMHAIGFLLRDEEIEPEESRALITESTNVKIESPGCATVQWGSNI